MVAARVGGPEQGRAAEKSCIFILLCGGPSHLDTWDLKPDAPAEIRGPYQPIATTVPGMRISELHPRLAKLTQHFCLIRSMTHAGQHQQPFRRHAPLPERPGRRAGRLAVHRLRPGQGPAQPAQRRLLRLADQVRRRPGLLRPEHRHRRPPRRPLRPAVRRLGRQPPGHAGLQGARRAVRPAEPPERMHGRRQLAGQPGPAAAPATAAGHERTGRTCTAAASSWRPRPGRARRSSWTASRAPCATATAATRWGRTCSWPAGSSRRASASSPSTAGPARRRARPAADRPVRAGTCTAATWAWATPSAPAPTAWAGACRASTRRCPPCSPTCRSAACWRAPWWWSSASSAARRGSTSTSGNPGRQHWPACYSAILAGGGIRGGMVYGESDKIGAYVKDKPVRPQDLGATIYHALGVPLDLRLTQGRRLAAPEHGPADPGAVRARISGKPKETSHGWNTDRTRTRKEC